MEVKLFEVRDVGTFIPCIATFLHTEAINNEEVYLLRRAGYNVHDKLILFGKLDGSDTSYDPYKHITNTMRHAHGYINKHWYELISGQVIDVEFIRGLSKLPKISERLE